MDAVVYRGGSANRASVRGFVQHVNEPEDRQDEIDTVAAAWAARLGGGRLSDAERRALDRWLGESPAHAAAFDEAQSAWRKMGELRAAPGALAEDIVAGQTVGRAAGPPVQRAGGRRIWPPAAALAACLLLVAMGAVWLGDPVALLMADHSTAPGAHQRVALSDGSSVELGPASAIALHFTDDERRVELLSGQAYFIAAPMNGDERRPFVVEAENGACCCLWQAPASAIGASISRPGRPDRSRSRRSRSPDFWRPTCRRSGPARGSMSTWRLPTDAFRTPVSSGLPCTLPGTLSATPPGAKRPARSSRGRRDWRTRRCVCPGPSGRRTG